MDAFGAGGSDYSVAFEAGILEFKSCLYFSCSPVLGVVTAPAWEGQVRVKSQDPVDSSPDGVSWTHVVGPLRPSSLSYLSSLKTVCMEEAPMLVSSGHLM